MDVIGLKGTKCRNCYRCVRSCALKAISIQDSQARILSDRCILCGRCLEVCPQNAKTLISDLSQVRQFLKDGQPVIVSLAPSHPAVFSSHTPGQTVQALLKLGFSAVHETAEGAALVTKEYRRLLNERKFPYLISSCCPSINELIEIYYPSLCNYLAPVISPMIAHGRLLKQLYGEAAKIVFIGPCISKKREAENDLRTKGAIDAVLNFHELEDWLRQENVYPSELPEAPFSGSFPGIHQLYPEEGGILASFSVDTFPSSYQRLSVSGLENCMELFSCLIKEKPEPCFFEVSACSGGCIHGSAMHSSHKNRFSGALALKRYVTGTSASVFYPVSEQTGGSVSGTEISLQRTFTDRSPKLPKPSEQEIKKVLQSLGKYTEQDLLNCGACGYPTCREKAAAVVEGKAELTMCLPYMQEKAQSMANAVLDHTPNIILILDQNGNILEYSKSAEQFFAPFGRITRGFCLNQWIETAPFLEVLTTKQPIYDRKAAYPALNRITFQKIIPFDRQDCVLVILQDITQEDVKQQAMKKLRLDAVEMAQKVIDRQMFVAQEIAGLLGETTAETKITLNRLRDMVENEDITGTNKQV